MAGIVRRATGVGVLALALGVGAARGAQAQAGWLRAPDAGFLALGAAGVATGELDERLAAHGYPTFGRTALAPSIGAYWSLPGGVTLGGEWIGLVLGEKAHQGNEVGLGGGAGTIGIGYVVELSPRARIHPRLGIGGGGIGLWVESEEEPVGFDEALTEPTPAPDRGSVLSRGSMVVDLGAGVELRPRGRARGPLIGLRFGYLAAPVSTDWSLKDRMPYERPVSGGPDATLAGPYLRATVGVGRSR